MKRTTLPRLAAAVALAAAGLLVSGAEARSESSSRSIHAPAASTRSTSATADVATSEGNSVAISRDSRNSQSSPLRSFAATLAALSALVALAAARATRTLAFRARDTTATFDARRRGPPLLHTC